MSCKLCGEKAKPRGKYCKNCIPLGVLEDYRNKRNEIQTTYIQKLRGKVLNFLGGRCSNPQCRWLNEDKSFGCTDKRALQIDHINGGGTKEYQKTPRGSVYLKILRGAEGYQLLCANCNWIKKYEKNEVPNLKSEAAGFAAGN